MGNLIVNEDDLYRLLDKLFHDHEIQWDRFYEDRSKPIPFFRNAPDENLVDWCTTYLSRPGRCLELGCGPGRNAIWLSQQGWDVEAIDVSREAIDWGQERMSSLGVNVEFVNTSIFEYKYKPHAYDLVYDSGCFHHLPPHRRMTYRNMVKEALSPNGFFGLLCFDENGGSVKTDLEIYQNMRLFGGLGYSEENLRAVLSPDFSFLEFRRMKDTTEDDDEFGVDFAWVALLKVLNS